MRDVRTLRRIHVDGLVQVAVQEGCYNIDLVAFEVVVVDKGEKNSDRVFACNTCKELCKVDAFNWAVSLCYPTCFVSDIDLVHTEMYVKYED